MNEHIDLLLTSAKLATRETPWASIATHAISSGYNAVMIGKYRYELGLVKAGTVSYSTEQIQSLRTILKTKGIPAIGRDEVSKFLGEHVKADAGLDYRDFYSMYTIRRDNARSRARLHLEGPHKTLEDYFIQFITEENKEKQNNDTFAKS